MVFIINTNDRNYKSTKDKCFDSLIPTVSYQERQYQGLTHQLDSHLSSLPCCPLSPVQPYTMLIIHASLHDSICTWYLSGSLICLLRSENSAFSDRPSNEAALDIGLLGEAVFFQAGTPLLAGLLILPTEELKRQRRIIFISNKPHSIQYHCWHPKPSVPIDTQHLTTSMWKQLPPLCCLTGHLLC